jgi:hypothetical protein
MADYRSDNEMFKHGIRRPGVGFMETTWRWRTESDVNAIRRDREGTMLPSGIDLIPTHSGPARVPTTDIDHLLLDLQEDLALVGFGAGQREATKSPHCGHANTTERMISILSARVFHRTRIRACCAAQVRGKAPGGIYGMGAVC